MKIKAIFLVLGHGKGSSGVNDDGAIAANTTERDQVKKIFSKTYNLLSNQDALIGISIHAIGYKSRMTLVEKINEVNKICNDNGLDYTNSLLISNHINAGGGNGIESWYYGGSQNSKDFAQVIINKVAEETGIEFHGASVKSDLDNRWGRLGIIRDTKPLAILGEWGFLDNANDLAFLQSDDGPTKFAIGIVKGF